VIREPVSLDVIREAVERANERATKARDKAVLLALKLTADPDREIRLAPAHQCIRCFYMPDTRLVGRAFTDWTCLVCGEPGRHSNTAVPLLCGTCSGDLHLCVTCCADLDLKPRRKLHRLLTKPAKAAKPAERPPSR
jgi:hypothetical protein